MPRNNPQNMTYTKAVELLGTRESRKVAGNTYLRPTGNGVIALELHGSAILKFFPDGTIEARSCGYETVTTKRRLNDFLPNGYGIGQTDYVWYFYHGAYENRKQMTFLRGVRIAPDGTPSNL